MLSPRSQRCAADFLENSWHSRLLTRASARFFYGYFIILVSEWYFSLPIRHLAWPFLAQV
ncbi:MAG: hypothetical protein ACK4FZ_06350 [Vogesella sp.]|uniref:hypothetical protein n=1 Tax=Vogesella sp. TaxID=1904252 RepID=UPI003918C9EC